MDAVWREIEREIGARVPWQHLQMGDPRCNRSCHGVIAGGRWTPVLDDTDPRDLRARDLFLESFRSMDVDRRPLIVAVATARVIIRHPQRGEVAPEADMRAAQERLQACSYSMAHPEEDLLVPACVQHSVLDPRENTQLRRVLPLHPTA